MSCAVLTLSLAAAACDAPADDVPPVDAPDPAELTMPEFDTASAYVITDTDTLPLRVELAISADEQAFGLMDRDALAQDAGMIFLYDQQQQSPFWMFRTRIGLDIAFFDGAGRIVSILQMAPCPNRIADLCPHYTPDAPYFGALEVNRGWMQQHGVEVGDRIVLPGRVGG